MKRKVKIEGESFYLEFEVEFFDNPTAKKILEKLPIESIVNLWGEEIYFDTGITCPSFNSTLDVEIKDFAYWPQGKCLCIFFGPTPLSNTQKPVPASEVVIVGKVNIESFGLKKVKSGYKIKIE
ncbi:MAG TPA: hypothetical protein EYP89_00560 [Candidatus Omnitrophica bacterium]|nr:hypothetical protein [Candidatus Omnitrophota bacterium]